MRRLKHRHRLPLPLDTRATTGYISIQDHGHPFRYRNIRIKELPSTNPEPNEIARPAEKDGSGEK